MPKVLGVAVEIAFPDRYSPADPANCRCREVAMENECSGAHGRIFAPRASAGFP
jgi:hypothetical protein